MEPWLNELLRESPVPSLPKWISRTASDQLDQVKLKEFDLKATGGVSQDEMSYYKEIFEFFDKDGNGTITTVELGEAMRTLGWNPTEGELQDLISVLDQEVKGAATFNEFVWLMRMELFDTDIEQEIREAFRVFDQEGNGFISTTELSEVLMGLGDKLTKDECEELVLEADINKDGIVNYEDFVSLLLKSSRQREKSVSAGHRYKD